MNAPPPLPPGLPPNLPPPRPPAAAAAPQGKSNNVLVIVLIAGGALLAMVVFTGLLAAIAIPNFVRARQTAQMNLCINHLRLIDGAKQQWALENKKSGADTPTEADLVGYFKSGSLPKCPAGGTYQFNPVSLDPACSVPEHEMGRMPQRTGTGNR